jgi:hypothetical protein
MLPEPEQSLKVDATTRLYKQLYKYYTQEVVNNSEKANDNRKIIANWSGRINTLESEA